MVEGKVGDIDAGAGPRTAVVELSHHDTSCGMSAELHHIEACQYHDVLQVEMLKVYNNGL